MNSTTSAVPPWAAWATSLADSALKVIDPTPVDDSSSTNTELSSATTAAETKTIWWAPPGRLRQRLDLGAPFRLLRRGEGSDPASYSYGGKPPHQSSRQQGNADAFGLITAVDDQGYVTVVAGSAPTVLTDDTQSGLDSTSQRFRIIVTTIDELLCDSLQLKSGRRSRGIVRCECEQRCNSTRRVGDQRLGDDVRRAIDD